MELELQENLYFREKYLSRIRDFYHETEIIKVISGVRRCGKSSLMQMIVRELLTQGISTDNIVYLNLDRLPYIDVTTPKQLNRLIKDNVGTSGIQYLFIDEIQNVHDFETVINGWREEGNFSIFITGSNSYLLSGELATKLTGRYIETAIYPLTFEEYLGMKKYLGISLSDDLDELNSYILEGGFPFALKLRNASAKKEYTQNLVEEIYEKDILSRIRIKNRIAFAAIMNYLIANFGSSTNINNIVNDLNKKGITIKRETVNRYIEALINAKILIRCDRFDMKSRKAINGEKKYYLSDLSFYYAISTDNKTNYGPVLENIVHNYALTYGYKVSIGKFNRFECDFILRSPENNYAYVQVAYTIMASEETENREYRPLEMIHTDNYPRYILTTDRLIQKRNGIIHANIMNFMKEERKFC